MAAAASGTAEPLAGAGHGSQQADDVVLNVATLGSAAVVEMTARLASSESGRQRGHEIVPEDSTRPAAESASSQAAVDLDALEARILREMGEVREGDEQPCICRVLPSIRDQEAEAYEPKLVCIGPLHRHNKSLLPMEEIKLSYLKKLLSRSEHNMLINYIRVIRDCEPRARKQYAEDIDMKAEEFVRMLVLDGCFIIEYFVKRVLNETKRTAQLSGVRWGFSHLRRDLMLLENQIPFFVLVALFDQSQIPFTGERQEPLTLMEVALGFLKVELPREKQPGKNQVLHLLHLHHFCLDPSRVTEQPHRCSFGQVLWCPFKYTVRLVSLMLFGLLYLLLIHKWPCCYFPTEESKVPRMIPCATELYKAGVKLKKKKKISRVPSGNDAAKVASGNDAAKVASGSDTSKGTGVNCYLKVSFTEGTLEIPFLRVQESTSSELRNLIALEQCCPKVGSYFTSYAIFMDNIIDTESDVAILRKYRIIESKLGSDKEVAKMFNTLCRGTHLDYKTHYNAPLFRAVTAYSEVPHHRWRASLKGRYFSNPWSIISLVAGFLLLFFAGVQAYFTAFPRKSK